MESKTFTIAVALACWIPVACQPGEASPPLAGYDASALRLQVEARDAALASIAWDFELTRLDSTGARVGPKGEPGGPPLQRCRLVTTTGAQRLERHIDQCDVTAVWDGEQVRERTKRAGRPTWTEEREAPNAPFDYGIGPLSFGVGFAGVPLAKWLDGPKLVDLGLEPVRGVLCRKLVILSHPAGSVATHPLHNTPQAVLWIDERDTLLVLRARSYITTERALRPTDKADRFEFQGRRYAPWSTFDVLETTRVGGYALPTRGRVTLEVPGDQTTTELDIHPTLAPEAGWPAGTFEL